MPECPACQTPGAYVGFNSIECRNPSCEHFSINQERVCPCCGRLDHMPGQDSHVPPVLESGQPNNGLATDGTEEALS